MLDSHDRRMVLVLEVSEVLDLVEWARVFGTVLLGCGADLPGARVENLCLWRALLLL